MQLIIIMKKIFNSLLLLFISGALGAQSPDSSIRMSAKQAVAYALEHHKDVLNSRIDADISKAQVKEVIGIGLPQLNASFDVKDYIELPTSLIPAEFTGGKEGEFIALKFGTQWNATAGISASQLLFDPSYLVGVQATRTINELARKNVSRTEIETAVAVYKAYYNHLILKERQKAINSNVFRMKKLLDDTKALYENGFVEKLDRDRVQVAYNNMMSEQGKFERLNAFSLQLLKFQMGMPLSNQLETTDVIDAAAIKNQSIPLDKFDAGKRIEYSILKTQQRLQEYNMKRYKVGYYPSLVAYGSLNTSAQRNEFDIFDSDKRWYSMAVVGATLNLPLFDGFQKSAKIRQERLKLRKIDNELLNFEEAVNLQVQAQRDALMNALNALEVQEQNLSLSTDIYNTAKLKYEQGVGSNLEVMDAETGLKDSQANYYNALYEAAISRIELDKALGNISY